MARMLAIIVLVLALLFGSMSGSNVDRWDDPSAEYDEPYVFTPGYMTGYGDYVDGAFTVTIPWYWEGFHIFSNETDTTYGVSLVDEASYLAGWGGHLFTLTFYPADTDYTDIPQYEEVGEVWTEDGVFEGMLVANLPTDVQYSEESSGSYHAKFDDRFELYRSLTPTDGYELKLYYH